MSGRNARQLRQESGEGRPGMKGVWSNRSLLWVAGAEPHWATLGVTGEYASARAAQWARELAENCWLETLVLWFFGLYQKRPQANQRMRAAGHQRKRAFLRGEGWARPPSATSVITGSRESFG